MLPTRPPTRAPTRPPPSFLPTTTQAPDYREECPGSCIVSLLSFTCFRNAEMTDLFKCAKSGTTCCAPKSRIHEVQGMMVRNDTFSVFVNPQNPQQPMPQYMANNNQYSSSYPVPPLQPVATNYLQQPNTNYPVPAPPNSFPLPAPMPVPQNNYQPLPPQNYAPIPQQPPPQISPNYPVPVAAPSNYAPAYSTPVYEIPTQPTTTTTTTTARTPVYSKYVCGVKGTSRTSRKLLLELVKLRPRDEIKVRSRRDAYKSSERLILGSELVPIEIGTDKLGDFAQQQPNDAVDAVKSITYDSAQRGYSRNFTSYRQSFNRQARVVGGEDGENGEWCWQVALINSMNQYLCGAALIGTQWVLTAAHCVTK